MKNRLEEDFERNKDFLIDKGSDYICSTCKKVHYPNEGDISRKRPSCYYRGCRSCRLKSFTKAREYKEKRHNYYDKIKERSSLVVEEG